MKEFSDMEEMVVLMRGGQQEWLMPVAAGFNNPAPGTHFCPGQRPLDFKQQQVQD